MAEWQAFRLIDVLDYKEGPGILAKDFHDDGVPLVRLAGVKVGAHILDGCNYLDPEKVASKWNHFRLEEGDTLLSTSASLGEVAVVPADGVGAVPYTGLIRFRPRDERVSGRFVPIALTSRTFKLQIEAMGVGSVMKHFGPMHLRQMELELPPRPVQEAIADVVEALDDKIAANSRLAATADKLAHALVGHATSTNSRVEQLAAIVEFHNKRRVPLSSREREARQGEVPYYGANGAIGFVDEAIFDDEYVLVGEDGTVVTSAGLPVVNYIWGAAWVNNHAHVISGRSVSTRLLRFLVSRTSVDSVITGAVQPKLSMGNLGRVDVTLPSTDVLPALEAQVESLMGVYIRAQDENATLEAMRDTLLPQLMSGKLRVGEAAEMVGL